MNLQTIDVKPHKPTRHNAWRGRKNHRRDTGVWLWEVHQQVPVWQQQWRRAVKQLQQQGRTRYRGIWIEREEALEQTNSVRLATSIYSGNPYGLGKVNTGEVAVLSPSNPELFLAVHGDLVGLVDSLKGAARQGQMPVVLNVLLGQWPNQDAWVRAVRHRAAMAKAGLTSKEPGRGWERILKERKNSLGLEKGKGGEWRTRNGGNLSQVFQSSTPSRQNAIRALTRLPGVVAIELPRHLKFTVVLKVARTLRGILHSNHPAVTQALDEGRTWCLAVRPIQMMGVKGCFDPATQTVIVDPRHLESAAHELCHWLLGHEPQWSSVESFHKAESEVESLLEQLNEKWWQRR